ncbi:MAG: ABC transporter permease [Bacteroidota bacterium]
MIKNYFKIAWRNLWKNKFYSLVNITGLAVGLAVGIMILFWVQDEFSFDIFHKNARSIYKINSHLGKGDDEQVWEGSPAPLAIFSKQSVPEVANSVRIENLNGPLLFKYADKKFTETNLACVDSTFFSVFDFKLTQGNPLKPFPDINSIILTSTEAKKYFGNDNAIGKVLATDYGNFTVSGIMEDFPENSSLQYNMLLPWALTADYFQKSGGNGDWKTLDEDLGGFSYQIYLQLQTGASPQVVEKKITSLYRDKKGNDTEGISFKLQSLQSRHLVARDGNTGALQTVRIFLLVAVLILIIASINYVNLSTARAMIRRKEVSMRKIIGAERYQLFIQFITESAVLFFLATLFSFLMIYLLFPLYNNLSGKQLVFSFTNMNVWIVIGSAVIGTLVLASIYPALLLSSFKPVEALKGKLSLGIGNTAFRKILVVTQFVFSVTLVIGTIVISNQLRYIRERNLGYNKEYVFSFELKGEISNHQDAVKDALLKQQGILSVATSDNPFLGEHSSTGDTYWEGKKENRTFLIHPKYIDQQFISLLNLQIVEGKNFTGSKSDSAHFILNETAVKQAGIADPLGKSFTLWQTKGTIIGVVKDFNYTSLKKSIEPAIFCYRPHNSFMFIKTSGKEAPAAVTTAEKIWKEYGSEFPFSFSFLEDDYNKMYQADRRAGVLFNAFAVIAILISCLGLFGLITYTAQAKIKEIGIRKVLGAGIGNITGLLAKEFIALVFVAFIIAAPVAWFAMNAWLQNYAYRISINWLTFFIAGASALLIALLTVSFQAVKAAMANPVKSLRSE